MKNEQDVQFIIKEKETLKKQLRLTQWLEIKLQDIQEQNCRASKSQLQNFFSLPT